MAKKNPRSRRQRGESSREHPETSFRDPFELDTRERRHRRPHRPSAPLQVGGQQGIHPLPEISSLWSTTLHLASWGKVLFCSWGYKEIFSCNCWIFYEIDLSWFLLMMLWCLIGHDLALGLLCSCLVYLDYINYRVLVVRYRLSSCSDSMREGKVWSWNTPSSGFTKKKVNLIYLP